MLARGFRIIEVVMRALELLVRQRETVGHRYSLPALELAVRIGFCTRSRSATGGVAQWCR